MQFRHGFSVDAPIDAVWAAIVDIERVAPLVPNVRVTGRTGPDSVAVEITAVLGPLAFTAQGTITVAERDDDARRQVLRVRVVDPDGDMLADAHLTLVLRQAATTAAAVHSTVEVGGLATLVGEEKLGELAGRTLATFARSLEAHLR